VIGRRLRLLSEDSRSILALAAVLGREFEFGALAHLSGLAEEQLLDVLEEAIRAHVLAEVPAAPERLRFAHALIRDTLYAELGALRRLRLHREVGEALEAFYGEDREPHLAELAHHFLSAGAAAPDGKATEYARAAGDRAVRLLAFEEAVRLYGMALDALRGDGAATDRTRCELLIGLADAEGRAGDDRAAKATYLRAAEQARLAGLPTLLARAAAGYGGRFLWVRGATDGRLVPLLEDALDALGDADSVLRVQLLSRLATALCDEPSRDRREDVWKQAVQAARRIGDPATLAYALDAGVAATEGPHNVEASLAQATEAVSLAARIGDRERSFGGHEHAFWCAWQLGDRDRRAAELASLTRVAQELQQPAQLWLATAAQATLALAEGRLGEAEGLIERARNLGERAQSWNATTTRKLQLFVLRRERAQLDGFEQEVPRLPARVPLAAGPPVRPRLRVRSAGHHDRIERRRGGSRPARPLELASGQRVALQRHPARRGRRIARGPRARRGRLRRPAALRLAQRRRADRGRARLRQPSARPSGDRARAFRRRCAPLRRGAAHEHEHGSRALGSLIRSTTTRGCS